MSANRKGRPPWVRAARRRENGAARPGVVIPGGRPACRPLCNSVLRSFPDVEVNSGGAETLSLHLARWGVCVWLPVRREGVQVSLDGMWQDVCRVSSPPSTEQAGPALIGCFVFWRFHVWALLALERLPVPAGSKCSPQSGLFKHKPPSPEPAPYVTSIVGLSHHLPDITIPGPQTRQLGVAPLPQSPPALFKPANLCLCESCLTHSFPKKLQWRLSPLLSPLLPDGLTLVLPRVALDGCSGSCFHGPVSTNRFLHDHHSHLRVYQPQPTPAPGVFENWAFDSLWLRQSSSPCGDHRELGSVWLRIFLIFWYDYGCGLLSAYTRPWMGDWADLISLRFMVKLTARSYPCLSVRVTRGDFLSYQSWTLGLRDLEWGPGIAVNLEVSQATVM